MADWIRDLRYTARTLRANPVFTIVTLLTLALAIGANTTIFSLIDPLVFRSLPVREPGRLVQFTWQYPGDPPLNMFGLQIYADYRARVTARQRAYDQAHKHEISVRRQGRYLKSRYGLSREDYDARRGRGACARSAPSRRRKRCASTIAMRRGRCAACSAASAMSGWAVTGKTRRR